MCGGCLSGLGVGTTNCTLFEHFFHHPMTSVMLLWSKDLNHFTLSSSTEKGICCPFTPHDYHILILPFNVRLLCHSVLWSVLSLQSCKDYLLLLLLFLLSLMPIYSPMFRHKQFKFGAWKKKVLKEKSYSCHRDSITTCLANIHSFMLRDCKQLPWAGDLSPEITLSTVKVHDRKKDQVKVQTSKVPNLPYSKTILHERIKYVSC